MKHYYLATNDGFVEVKQQKNEWVILRRGLNGRKVTSLIAREGVILAGTDNGIFRSDDGGGIWGEASSGLTQRHIRWMAYHPDISDMEFAGTEPAALFHSQDGGESWQERIEVGKMRDQFGWWMPYSSEAGCVRSFAFHESRAYAAVEVGAALRSDDYGASWQLVVGSNGRPTFTIPSAHQLHADVHSIFTYPHSADWVLAATGGGLYQSQNGGKTWQCLHKNYVRTAWINPTNINQMIIGPADGPSRNGRILLTNDSGNSWEPCSQTWSNSMPERFHQLGNAIFSVMSNGKLLYSDLNRFQWQPILSNVHYINDITIPKD